jgi:cell division protein FtsB
MEVENDALKNRIEEYKRGSVVEAKARDDLGMIKKGEKIYIITEEE